MLETVVLVQCSTQEGGPTPKPPHFATTCCRGPLPRSPLRLAPAQLGAQSEAASREEAGTANGTTTSSSSSSGWTEAVRVGAPVRVEVQEVREYGLVLGFPGVPALSTSWASPPATKVSPTA